MARAIREPFSAWVCAAALASAAAAQAPPGDAEPAPGLILTFEREAGGRDARVARLVALHVAEGSPPTPFLAPGPFRATWRGGLEIRLRDRYAFSFEGTGRIAVTVGGAAVELGEEVRLRAGVQELEVRYQAPERGPAVARLLWSGSDFAPEPISPLALSHDPADAALRAAQSARRGREQLANLHCTKCHAPPRALVLAENAMPELARDAPVLIGVGARLRVEWLERWVLSPRAVRAGATMPAMLRGEHAAQEARDIAAWLGSLGEAPPAAAAPDPSAAARGGILFGELGCVGCHTLPDAAGDPERVALRGVGQKWHPPALAEFLREPSRGYAWTGMPDFGLAAGEAADLAAFLLARDAANRLDAATGALAPAAATAATPAGDAGRGRELVLTRGCLKCHFAGETGQYRAPDFAALSRFDHGCLAADAFRRGAAPDFGLDARARADVARACSDVDSLGRCAPAEFAARSIDRLRCNACHARDGEEAKWSLHAAETAPLLEEAELPRLAQHRPALTWSGGKLRTEWTAKLLRGEVAERPRPWLRARMPAFEAAADTLAAGLAAQHGYPPDDDPQASLVPDPERAAVGKKLIGSEAGFACVLCHAVGGRPPLGVFEAQGIDLAYTAGRLRKPYFLRWMSNPLRIDPASRMPKYTDASGRTGFVDVLGGDGRRQFEAMWEYLAAGRDL